MKLEDKCILTVVTDAKTGEYISTISSDEEQTHIYYQDKTGDEAQKFVSFFPAILGGSYRVFFEGTITYKDDNGFKMEGEEVNDTWVTLEVKKNKITELKLTWAELSD